MKTTNIQGKEYVEVNERVKYFRKNYPKYSLTTKIIEKTNTSILIKAIIRDEKKRKIATGIAEEIKGSSFINKTSHVENCETSAWGRALGNFGIGIDTSIASSDEVQNARLNQPKQIEWTEKILNQTKGKIISGQTTLADVKKKVVVPEEIETKLLEVIS